MVHAAFIAHGITTKTHSIAEVTEAEVLEMAPMSHEFVESLKPLLKSTK